MEQKPKNQLLQEVNKAEAVLTDLRKRIESGKNLTPAQVKQLQEALSSFYSDMPSLGTW